MAAYTFTFTVIRPSYEQEELLSRWLRQDIEYGSHYDSRRSKEPRASLVLHINERVSEDSAEHLARFMVDRECDRFYFLTGLNLQPRLEHAPGQRVGAQSLSVYCPRKPPFRPHTENVGSQRWDEKIETMLRLWRLAMGEVLHPTARILLLYQIVELVAPPSNQKLYKPYGDSRSEPNPYTEAKLLRHLIAHQSGRPRRELGNYCQWLGIPQEFPKPSQQNAWQAVQRRIQKLESLAASLIDVRITRNHGLLTRTDERESRPDGPEITLFTFTAPMRLLPLLKRCFQGNISHSANAKDSGTATLKVLTESHYREFERECDRLFFLTQFSPKWGRVRMKRHGLVYLVDFLKVVAIKIETRKLPPLSDLSLVTWQKWDELTANLLCLWRIAQDKNVMEIPRILLLFQIVELGTGLSSQKPHLRWESTHGPPDEYTEAQLLRDLASHQRDTMIPVLRDYCGWLGIAPRFPQPNTWKAPNMRNAIGRLTKLAASIIDQRISRLPRGPNPS